MLLRFLGGWIRWAERRRQARAVGEALGSVRAAARTRPLCAERLADAARAALAVEADPLGVVRAAMTGASMSNPADPDDLGHRELAYATVRQVVYGARSGSRDGEGRGPNSETST